MRLGERVLTPKGSGLYAPAETAAMAAGPFTYAGVTRAERARWAEELAPNGLIFGAKRR